MTGLIQPSKQRHTIGNYDLLGDKVICSVSGAEPSQYCPDQRSEIFAADQPPLAKEDDLWKTVRVDTWTNLTVSPACEGFTSDKYVANITDPWAIKWINEKETK